jgi:membrane associated rhomboid family serine protease
MLRITDVVKHLLIINILMFLASNIFSTSMLALHYPASENFRTYQIITHFFMHANLAHLFFNMFALVMFGSALEAFWGPRRFLFFYIVCALGAALLHNLWNYYDFSQMQRLIEQFQSNPTYDHFWAFFNETPLPKIKENEGFFQDMSRRLRNGDSTVAVQTAHEMQRYLSGKMSIPVVGASGAIFGLLLAFGMYFPNTELMLIFLPIPIKAKYFIPILMLVELYLGVNQFSWDNIAHFAHLGGALTGFLLILYWRKVGGRY